MPPQIQHKRGTSSDIASVNPILLDGEIVFETDTKKFKFGDGSTSWNNLPYAVLPNSGVSISGINIISGSGNFNTLTVSSVPVSVSGHSHTSANITNFNSSVSGLLSKTFATFTAQNNQPPSSSFATIDTRNSILVLDFDDASVESAVFMGVVPEGLSFPSGIQTSIDWIATSATAGNVRWRVEFEKGNTDYDADSFDTSAEGNGTANATAGIPITTNITTTSIDSLVAGDLFRLKVSRVGNDATNDTMAGDAELVAIELRRV